MPSHSFHLIIPGTEELRLLSVLGTKSALVALVPDAQVLVYSADGCFSARDLTSGEYLIAVKHYDWEAFQNHPMIAEHTWVRDLECVPEHPGMVCAEFVGPPLHGPEDWDTRTTGIRPEQLPDVLFL